jgi:hypothetical protein
MTTENVSRFARVSILTLGAILSVLVFTVPFYS